MRDTVRSDSRRTARRRPASNSAAPTVPMILIGVAIKHRQAQQPGGCHFFGNCPASLIGIGKYFRIVEQVAV